MNADLTGLLAAGGSLAVSVNWDTMGWVVGLTLIAILSLKELVRAFGGPRTSAWMRASNVVVVPLLVLFAVAMVARVLPILMAG